VSDSGENQSARADEEPKRNRQSRKGLAAPAASGGSGTERGGNELWLHANPLLHCRCDPSLEEHLICDFILAHPLKLIIMPVDRILAPRFHKVFTTINDRPCVAIRSFVPRLVKSD